MTSFNNAVLDALNSWTDALVPWLVTFLIVLAILILVWKIILRPLGFILRAICEPFCGIEHDAAYRAAVRRAKERGEGGNRP